MGAGREEVMRKGGGEESRSVRRWRAEAVSIVATPAMSMYVTSNSYGGVGGNDKGIASQ